MDITRYVMCCCSSSSSSPFTISKLLSFFPFSSKHWHRTVYPRKWTFTDESGVAGWYHSVMTIGLNHTIGPKLQLIYTCATLHTVSITVVGSLCTYKLFGRTYGGKSDEDINDHN